MAEFKSNSGTYEKSTFPKTRGGLVLDDYRTVQKKNDTGLPDNLKSGVENLSGYSMDDVKVHYNSPKPAQLNAHAYAQGTDIHLASGQEKHLPHEAWHVVQQKQGRVKPTLQMKGKVNINDDAGLEKEADEMGERAKGSIASKSNSPMAGKILNGVLIQPKWINRGTRYLDWDTPIQGVIWHYDQRTRKMFYTVPGGDSRHIRGAGAQNAKSREEWVRLHGSDPLVHEDPGVIGRPAYGTNLVELGAGEGRFSKAFRRKFAGRRGGYLATDVAEEEGPTGFLSHAKAADIATQYGLDANKVGKRFPPQSVSTFIGANPYGVRNDEDASYGLKRYNSASARMVPDARFLASARTALKPDGQVVFYGRTNALNDHRRSRLPKVLHKKDEPSDERRRERAELIASEKVRIDAALPRTNENPFLKIPPDDLSALAKQTRYRVRVKRAKQPPNTAPGGDPDTIGLAANTRQGGLQDFTTRYTFTPADDGYISDDEHPRVEYDSGDASDWEEDDE